MRSGLARGWRLGPSFGLGETPTPVRDPAEGLGQIVGPSLFGLLPQAENIVGEEDGSVAAAAAARRSELAHILMKRARESSQDPNSAPLGPWAALPGVATALTGFFKR